MRSRAMGLLLVVTASACATHAAKVPSAPPPTIPVEAAPPLYRNLYLQNADLTTHVVVRSGEDGRMGRIIVADPRGNTGVGFWSDRVAGERGIVVTDALREVTSKRGVHGVAVALSGPPAMRIRKYLLGNVRELRDAEQDAGGSRDALLAGASKTLAAWGAQPDPATEQVRQTMLRRLVQWQRPARVVDPEQPGAVVLEREALGSGALYRVELVPARGTKIDLDRGDIVIRGERRSAFELRTYLDRPRLAPLARLFKEGDGGAMGEALRFLASGEKLLAGSWQYLTYFGRDTMISAALLADRAAPELLAMAVGSVLDRVSPEGIPAHEEDIGDQATLRNLGPLLERIRATPGLKLAEADLAALEKPVFDTKMIDGEFLLPQLVDRLVTNAPPADIARALQGDRLAALARVLGRIDTLTARAPTRASLIAFNEGEKVGDWRDSHEGNGLGHVPLDVSAYLVPSALEAIASLAANPKFPKDALLGVDRARVGKLLDAKALLARRDAWKKASREAFAVSIDRATASSRLAAALAKMEKDEADAFLAQRLLGTTTTLRDALASGALPKSVRFSGIALDDRNQAIPVQSSDAIFDLFYGKPGREDVLAHAETLFQPYPLGLMTPVGVATSNATFSDRPQDQELFGKGKYHGSKVVWGWQQPMLAQGIEKQLGRFATDTEVTRVLTAAKALVASAAENVGAVGTKAEAWAWTTKDAKIRAVPYGADAGDATEANDRQLWTIAGSLGAGR